MNKMQLKSFLLVMPFLEGISGLCTGTIVLNPTNAGAIFVRL